jgi:hypothetical protein
MGEHFVQLGFFIKGLILLITLQGWVMVSATFCTATNKNGPQSRLGLQTGFGCG